MFRFERGLGASDVVLDVAEEEDDDAVSDSPVFMGISAAAPSTDPSRESKRARRSADDASLPARTMAKEAAKQDCPTLSWQVLRPSSKESGASPQVKQPVKAETRRQPTTAGERALRRSRGPRPAVAVAGRCEKADAASFSKERAASVLKGLLGPTASQDLGEAIVQAFLDAKGPVAARHALLSLATALRRNAALCAAVLAAGPEVRRASQPRTPASGPVLS